MAPVNQVIFTETLQSCPVVVPIHSARLRKMFVNKWRHFQRPLPSLFCKKNFYSTTVNTDNAQFKSSSGIPEEEFFKDHRILYEGHIPTSLLQKLLLTVGASIMSISNPFRHDMIAVLGETTGSVAAKQIQQAMLQNEEGSRILMERPRINSETLNYNYLQSLPEGTFGHAYLKFLTDNDVTPDSRQPVHFVDDPELAYVIQRYREIHDLVHTLLGMPTNMLGEVAVKWVEAIQTGLPMCVAGAVLGPLRFRPKQRQKYVTTYLPWALNCGFRAKFLMNVYFEQRWEENLVKLREELNIPMPP